MPVSKSLLIPAPPASLLEFNGALPDFLTSEADLPPWQPSDETPAPEALPAPEWPVNRLIEGDCLEKLAEIPDASVHLILCDLPYGTTQNPWDSLIPLDALWAQYRRILAPRGVVVLSGQGPFTARLVLSNEAWFKYKFCWVKSKPTNFLNARRQPLRRHEDLCVFYGQQPDYFPPMQPGEAYDKGVRKAQFTRASRVLKKERKPRALGGR